MRKLTITDCEVEVLVKLYRKKETTLMEVVACFPEWRSQTVSTFLKSLEEKGYVKHFRRGRQYLYQPMMSKEECFRAAKKRFYDLWEEKEPE